MDSMLTGLQIWQNVGFIMLDMQLNFTEAPELHLLKFLHCGTNKMFLDFNRSVFMQLSITKYYNIDIPGSYLRLWLILTRETPPKNNNK